MVIPNERRARPPEGILGVSAGFTLIELMIVTAIIGILAAIAVPQYRDYVARTQFSEALILSRPLKIAVDERYPQQRTSQGITFQGINSGTALIPPAADVSGAYVSRVNVLNAIITVHFRPESALAGKTVKLRPVPQKGDLRWICTSTAPPARAPSACR